MSDDSVRAALRSDAPLVVVEAPAGCGKTHQGADYAREIAVEGSSTRLLILTHTHAACSAFSDRTKGAGSRVEIRTIDSVITHIASAYHTGLGLPADTATWVWQRDEGYAELAIKVARLLNRHPMIAASMAQRYPVVICDEHQDSSGDQHSVVMTLLGHGARLRLFADPMQKIFKDRTVDGACPPCDWAELTRQAMTFECLNTPHRWASGCPDLGRWTLKMREALKTGGKVDLRNGLPPSVSIVFAENQAQRNLEYQLSRQDRKPIDNFEQSQSSLLILTHYNDTARSFRGFFNRRIPLWEGHTRSGLEKLVDALRAGQGDCVALAKAIVTFMNDVGKGFSSSAFGNKFEQEARERCTGNCRGKPATIQELARFLVVEPNHHGVAKMLRRLSELKNTDSDFAGIEMDCYKEFWDARQPRRFRYRRHRHNRDYPPPDVFAAEASAEGYQHHPQSEGPTVRQRHHHAVRRQNLPGQARRKVSPLRRAQPGEEPPAAGRFAEQPKPIVYHLINAIWKMFPFTSLCGGLRPVPAMPPALRSSATCRRCTSRFGSKDIQRRAAALSTIHFILRSLLFDPEFVHLFRHRGSGRRLSVAAIGRLDMGADFF